jgi:hypothetical protein
MGRASASVVSDDDWAVKPLVPGVRNVQIPGGTPMGGNRVGFVGVVGATPRGTDGNTGGGRTVPDSVGVGKGRPPGTVSVNCGCPGVLTIHCEVPGVGIGCLCVTGWGKGFVAKDGCVGWGTGSETGWGSGLKGRGSGLKARTGTIIGAGCGGGLVGVDRTGGAGTDATGSFLDGDGSL